MSAATDLLRARPAGRGYGASGAVSTAAPQSIGTSAITGALTAVGALLAYLPGLGRPYGWDESVTVRNFVATPSLLDPFRAQIEYNNHPLLSIIDHLIYSATGSTDEALMRLAPLLAVVAAVGLLTAVCTRRLGMLPGVTAGALLAANPLVVEAARTARGYGLLVLCTVASSIVLLDLVRDGRPSRWRAAAYVGTVALGVCAHMYMALVVMVHATYVVASHGRLRPWIIRWAIALAVGGSSYVGLAAAMLASPQRGPFRAELLGDVTVAVLGGGLAAAAVLPALLMGATAVWRLTASLAAACMVAALLSVDALILHPAYLYPRFFVWAIPAMAVVAAIGVARIPLAAGSVGVAVTLMVVGVLPGYTKGDVGNKAAAVAIISAQSRGDTVCADSPAPLQAYVKSTLMTTSAENLGACDVVVLLYRPSDYARVVVASGRPFQVQLDGKTPGVIYARRPLMTANP